MKSFHVTVLALVLSGCSGTGGTAKTVANVTKLTFDETMCVFTKIEQGVTDPLVIAVACAPTAVKDITDLLLARKMGIAAAHPVTKP